MQQGEQTRNEAWRKNLFFGYNNSPCKDCPDRHVGCHGECERYQEFNRSREAYREEHRKELETRNAVWSGSQKRKDKYIKKNGSLKNKGGGSMK